MATVESGVESGIESRIESRIELVGEDDVRTRGGGRGKKSGKYISYRNAIRSHIPWFKRQISVSKDGVIRFRAKDIKNIIPGTAKKHDTTIYWGLKYAMWHEGDMVVTQGKHKNGDEIFIIRLKKEGDILPPSLSKGKDIGDVGDDEKDVDVRDDDEKDVDDDNKYNDDKYREE